MQTTYSKAMTIIKYHPVSVFNFQRRRLDILRDPALFICNVHCIHFGETYALNANFIHVLGLPPNECDEFRMRQLHLKLIPKFMTLNVTDFVGSINFPAMVDLSIEKMVF